MLAPLELRDLAPEPTEEWRRLLRFVEWGEADRRAATRSVEPLLRRGPELVAGTYQYLGRFPETAAILGWEHSVDEAHLEERRRFFTVWIARTLGLDTSDELAQYLFRAGEIHAGLGPRAVQVPPAYVTGSIGRVLADFAHTLAVAGLPADDLASAMAAWAKYLMVQLDLMLLGYQAARDLRAGALAVPCSLYGRLRPLLETHEVVVHADAGETMTDVLRKFFNAYPRVRQEALDQAWEPVEDSTALWDESAVVYRARPGWRVLLNGRDLAYGAGFQAPVAPGAALAIFPPGR